MSTITKRIRNLGTQIFLLSVLLPVNVLNAQMHTFYSPFVPQTTDPTMTVNVRFYVFSPTSGVGVYDQVTQSDCSTAVADANQRLANNPAAKILVQGVTDILDTKIRLNMVGYHFIDDQTHYNSPSTAYPSWIDPNAINVFLGYGNNTGVSPGPLIGGLSRYGLYIRFGATSPSNINTEGETLLHELGHMLGLPHSITTGNIWAGDHWGCFEFGVWDYHRNTVANECCNCKPGDLTYGNNLMNADKGCDKNLSPGQMAVMHYNLRTRFASCLQPASYAAATVRDPSADYVVTQNEVWSGPKYMEGNVTVQTGKTLSITCQVAMTHGAKITVEPGALLVLDGGRITNLAGRMWLGIEVLGNPAHPHGNTNPNMPLGDLYQGVIRMKNNSVISNAEIGITDHSRNFTQPSGMIFCGDSRFIDNGKDVRFWGSSQFQNYSWLGNCTLTVNGPTLNDGNQPIYRVELQYIRGVKIWGCVMEYTGITGSGGKGIGSMDADYSVAPTNLSPSIIKKFDDGVYVVNVNPLALPSISRTQFLQNKLMGAYFSNVHNLIFEKNTIQNPSSSAAIGVYLDNCRYYKIKGNSFNEFSTSHLSTGIDINRSLDGAHEVYGNNFSLLGMAVNVFNNNNSPANATNYMLSTTGLKMNCNNFNPLPGIANTYNIYDISLTANSSTSKPSVHKVQGSTNSGAPSTSLVRNIYSAPVCANSNMFYVDPSCNMTIDHGSWSNSSGVITLPSNSCKSSQVSVVDMQKPFNYSSDCPGSTASSGGNFTSFASQLSNLNSYASSLRKLRDEDGIDVSNELQSTLATKANCFLADSLGSDLDSALAIYTQNQGNFERNEALAIYTLVRQTNFEEARSRIDDLYGINDQLAVFFDRIVNLYDNGGEFFTLNAMDEDYFRGIAGSSNDPEQMTALNLLRVTSGFSYSPPHPVPIETIGGRKRSQDALYEPLNDMSGSRYFNIYPNPTQGELWIDYHSKNGEPASLELCDLLGRVLSAFEIQSGVNNLEMGQLSNGLYIVTLKDQTGKVLHHRNIVVQQY